MKTVAGDFFLIHLYLVLDAFPSCADWLKWH